MLEEKKPSSSLLTKIAVIVVDLNWYCGLLGLLIFFAIAVITATGSGPGNGLATVPVQLEFSVDEPPAVQYLAGNAVLRIGKQTGNWGQLATAPVSLLFLAIAFLLRKVVRSARDGNPFTFDNVRKVRWIGIFLMLYGPLLSIANYIVYLGYNHYLNIPGAVIKPGFNVSLLITCVVLGLLILVLAQVFDMGVRLQTDNDLTV